MGKRQRIKDSLTLTLVMSKLGGRYNDPLTLTVSKIWGHPTEKKYSLLDLPFLKASRVSLAFFRIFSLLFSIILLYAISNRNS